MGRRTPNITGQVFGRLRVLIRDWDAPGPHVKWICWCAIELDGCGTMVSVGSGALRSGMTQSCGCLHSERTAASNAARTSLPVRRNTRSRPATADAAAWKTSSPSYGSWRNMIRRCTDPDDPRYKDWGGRGITIDPGWLRFENFLTDMGERPAGKTLNRKDNNGPYAKWNCEWATPHEQQVNSRNFKLEPGIVAEISRLRATGMTLSAIGSQTGLHRHTVSRALSGKTRQRSKKAAT